ncbi:glutaminyl-peptide cyclotransferase [Spirosoma aerophilum]
MKRRIYLPASLLLAVLFFTGCQKKKAAQTDLDQTSPPVQATLLKTTYTVGDTITLQVGQPLSQVSISIDEKPAPIIQQLDSTIRISSQLATVGLHQLIIRGITREKVPVSDTLGIEFWSDIKPQNLDYSVLKTYPHQPGSFTQGLEFYKGNLYESTGLNGKSRLMQVDLQTGTIQKAVPLSDQYFGEGITIVNDKIYQLTWTSGICFRYTLNFAMDKTFTYHTQGWGLTHRDTTLILSDGSNRLFFLTPAFQPKGELSVYDNTGPVMNLNELEYVDGFIYANIWKTNRIVKIDMATGKVVGNLNMERILPTSIDTQENVLNGIAFQPKENAFYVTGKNWPTLYKIQLKPARKGTENRTLAVR